MGNQESLRNIWRSLDQLTRGTGQCGEFGEALEGLFSSGSLLPRGSTRPDCLLIPCSLAPALFANPVKKLGIDVEGWFVCLTATCSLRPTFNVFSHNTKTDEFLRKQSID